jgi:hypothetical protein
METRHSVSFILKALPIALIYFLCNGALMMAADVQLAWDASTSPSIVGYRVYIGNSSGSYNPCIPIGNQTTYTAAGLTDGTWYFAVTAVNGDGLESGFSNEVSKIIGSSDTTPPAISGVTSLSVTSSGATITWTTDEASNSQVEFGTTTNYGSSTTLNSSMMTSHSQSLTGLTTNTLYYYRVRSSDAAGNLATLGGFAFRTTAVQDTTPPTISGVYSLNITASTATISWSTNEASNTQIDYGITTSYGASTALDGGMAMSHSQTLAGLIPNTVYYYRVRSSDAAGNLATLAGLAFTTASVADAIPPSISGVNSLSIGSSTATVIWSTNEAANSQVEYGTTAGYGYTTTPDAAMVVAHSEVLTNLAPNTLYYYRVKSRDATGNLAISGGSAFTTKNVSAAPAISLVGVSNITNRSALITWDTDKPADSEIRYWTMGGAVRKARLNALVTQHSMTLGNLKKETVYHFIINAVDSSYNRTESSELSFTTFLNGSLAAVVPRFTSGDDRSSAGDQILIGMAFTNSSNNQAAITFTARDADGNLITGQDIVNPAGSRLNASEQSAMLDIGVFGEGLSHSSSKGWIELEGNTSDVGGFFLTFDIGLSLMDGTSFGDAPRKDFAFTEIEANGSTKIDIANNNPEDAFVAFNLMHSNGSVRAAQSRVIKANGALVADLHQDLFPGIAPAADNYILMNSTQGVQSFEMTWKAIGDVASLSGQDVSEGGTVLYSPQYVSGDIWRTTLSVINLDSHAGNVGFQLIGDDGIQIGETKLLQISALGKLFINDPAFFQQPGSGEILSGYVKIASDDVRLAGSTVFGHRDGESFSSALPLIYDLQNSVVFSHVASNDLYFTGLAIVNPNDSDAMPALELYSEDGVLLERNEVELRAGQRTISLLPGFFSSLTEREQASGYIRIVSAKPLASFALFGTHNLSVLSAIPPKTVQ